MCELTFGQGGVNRRVNAGVRWRASGHIKARLLMTDRADGAGSRVSAQKKYARTSLFMPFKSVALSGS